jgi:hypothetical protein
MRYGTRVTRAGLPTASQGTPFLPGPTVAGTYLGHLAARDHAWATRLHTWRTQMGAVPGPMEVRLASTSSKKRIRNR